jgi:hypothetical protein
MPQVIKLLYVWEYTPSDRSGRCMLVQSLQRYHVAPHTTLQDTAQHAATSAVFTCQHDAKRVSKPSLPLPRTLRAPPVFPVQALNGSKNLHQVLFASCTSSSRVAPPALDHHSGHRARACRCAAPGSRAPSQASAQVAVLQRTAAAGACLHGCPYTRRRRPQR